MAFVDSFLSWFNDSVTVEPWNGTHNGAGDPNYSAGVVRQAHIQQKISQVRDLQGNERVSTSKVFIAGAPVSPFDRLTMPVTFLGNQNPPILSVANRYDEAGAFSHAEVYV